MKKEDLFQVEFSEDGRMGIEFSEDFLSSSLEEQGLALEDFLRKKNLEPSSMQEVNKAMAHNEITIIVTEIMLAKLKRGERIERGTDIDISLDELMAE